eukprot:COSAG02_NODE_862_length_16418_cov_5.730621_10_plen_54_part_00
MRASPLFPAHGLWIEAQNLLALGTLMNGCVRMVHALHAGCGGARARGGACRGD